MKFSGSILATVVFAKDKMLPQDEAIRQLSKFLGLSRALVDAVFPDLPLKEHRWKGKFGRNTNRMQKTYEDKKCSARGKLRKTRSTPTDEEFAQIGESLWKKDACLGIVYVTKFYKDWSKEFIRNCRAYGNQSMRMDKWWKELSEMRGCPMDANRG